MIPAFDLIIDFAGKFSLYGVVCYISARIVNSVLGRLIDNRVLSKVYRKVRLRYNAFKTRYEPIRMSHEFSAYLSDQPTLPEASEDIERVVQKTIDSGESIHSIEGLRWVDPATARIRIKFSDNDTFKLDINLHRDKSDFEETTPDQASVTKIGFKTDFEFPFHNVKGAILNAGTFARILRKKIDSEFVVDRFSDSQLTVQSIKKDLTLDQWIEQQQFEVSLLLSSESGSRSVEFYPDRAIVKSPYPEIDDTTAEYIRATLLNYYL